MKGRHRAWFGVAATCFMAVAAHAEPTARRILGRGKRGLVDGPDARAQLSFPNGIACDPWAPRLYINEYLNDSEAALPRRMTVRVIDLEPRAPS